jgi:hypothetical protein
MNYIKRIFNYLYLNWHYMTPLIAIYSLLILYCNYHSMPLYILLIWLQFPVYLLHQFEEHSFPGHFIDFVNRNLFHVMHQEVPLNQINAFWINIPFIFILFPLCAAIAQLSDPVIGLFLPFFGLFNATTHIMVFFVFRKYNPGLLVSTFLNYPTGIYTLVVAHQIGLLTWETGIMAFIAALVGHAAMLIYAVRRYRKFQRAGKLRTT